MFNHGEHVLAKFYILVDGEEVGKFNYDEVSEVLRPSGWDVTFFQKQKKKR